MSAQINILQEAEAQCIFAGSARTVGVVLHNESDLTHVSRLRLRLYQASSSLLLPVNGGILWKDFRILGKQTVVENITMAFPPVRIVTDFIIRITDDAEERIGDLRIRVAPDNLLKPLSSLVDNKPVGVFDPENQIKQLLKQNGVGFHDLEKDGGFDGFHGKLAIIGPLESNETVPAEFYRYLSKRRTNPVALVWIQPLNVEADPLLSVYLVRENYNTIAVVRSDVVNHLVDSPKAQLSLLHASQLALNPESLRLPAQNKP